MVSVMDQMINSAMKSNDFPNYIDGDVLIIISPEQQYHLHSTTLRTQSTYFRTILIEETAAQLAPKAKKEGILLRWRIELRLPDDPGDHVGELLVRSLDPWARPRGPPLSSHPFLQGKEMPILYTHYDNLLRCYFHQPPALDPTSFGTTLRDVVGLTDIAEYLGSVPCVTNALDIALLTSGEVLYRSIASNPPAWGDLAVRMRSEILLKESVVHLVGQWHGQLAAQPEIVSSMRDELRDLCKRKADELDERKKAAEMRILGHYPTVLQALTSENQNVGVGSRTIRNSGQPTRANVYSQRIMDWMALNLFRHWVGQTIAGDMSRRAKDGGLDFYRAVAAGGEAYLGQHAREAFSRHFPLSAKARTNFDVAVNGIKDCVKPFVQELIESKCTLDVTKWPLEWLTCAKIERQDCPWVRKRMQAERKPNPFGPTRRTDEDSTPRKGGNTVDLTDTMDIDSGTREGWDMIQKQDLAASRKLRRSLTGISSPVSPSKTGNVDMTIARAEEEDEGDDEDESDEGDEAGKYSGNAFGSSNYPTAQPHQQVQARAPSVSLSDDEEDLGGKWGGNAFASTSFAVPTIKRSRSPSLHLPDPTKSFEAEHGATMEINTKRQRIENMDAPTRPSHEQEKEESIDDTHSPRPPQPPQAAPGTGNNSSSRYGGLTSNNGKAVISLEPAPKGKRKKRARGAAFNSDSDLNSGQESDAESDVDKDSDDDYIEKLMGWGKEDSGTKAVD